MDTKYLIHTSPLHNLPNILKSGKLLISSSRAPSTAAGNGMGRLPPPVSPAAIAAATGHPTQSPALTYIAQENNLRARNVAR